MIHVRIQGIPATIEVHRADYTPPDPLGPSTIDFSGGWDMEYTICDRHGRPAPWLERKASDSDIRSIEWAIMEQA